MGREEDVCTQVLETDERRRKMPQRRWKRRGVKKGEGENLPKIFWCNMPPQDT